jgi:hypothetical protein
MANDEHVALLKQGVDACRRRIRRLSIALDRDIASEPEMAPSRLQPCGVPASLDGVLAPAAPRGKVASPQPLGCRRGANLGLPVFEDSPLP